MSKAKNDGRKLWSTLNEIMGKRQYSAASYVENDRIFITNPEEIANYFKYDFIDKVHKLRLGMTTNDYIIRYNTTQNNE